MRPHPDTTKSPRWILLPREHGAWGMVSFPFLAAAAIAYGSLFSLSVAAAILAVLSAFLLRDPLTLLSRIRREPARMDLQDQRPTAVRSLFVCLGGLLVSGTALLLTLPPVPVVVLGAGGIALVAVSVQIAVQRIQREITSQVLGAVGLTASCLPAYLAVRGRLDWLAFAIWAMSATHAIASVLVVRARLETILSRRRSSPSNASGRFHRSAIAWQAIIVSVLLAMGLTGHLWIALPFLIPGALHTWELWRFRFGQGLELSMHRVGWLQLAASLAFYTLLILLFHYRRLG